MPTDTMTKMEISSSKRFDVLLENIVLHVGCMTSVKSFFHAQEMYYKFQVCRTDKHVHGLLGEESNRARPHERERFGKFIMSHRKPTGRIIQNDGRSYGEIDHIDSVFTCIRPYTDSDADRRSSIVGTFNIALEKERVAMPPITGNAHITLNRVCATSVETWMWLDFGPSKFFEHRKVASEEHTTFYAHKKDVCTRCEVLNGNVRSLTKRNRRHEQQPDQGTLTRQNAISDLAEAIKE